ncbi:MAG: hypothetical protein COW02_07710 [Comamonadaceae bacterium CG12_big_fil_rev_8_21_14_0_65_59_15]|nr:MAG: hypothetical protein COW02_07710 [Comamonadaceae bacterium CG12_big_fil_rev_8_21_14_0_65_59_15]
MSCNESESGRIKLPKAEFNTVRKAVLSKATEVKMLEFEALEKLYEMVSAAIKGKRREGLDWQSIYDKQAEKLKVDSRVYRSYGFYSSKYDGVDILDLFYKLVVSSKVDGKYITKLVRPKKGDFKPEAKTMSFGTGWSGGISFDRDNSLVVWCVSENNHAVRDARDNVVARAFFGALNSVKWGRGSGGVIHYQSEYTREGLEHGDPGSTVSGRFGPLGKI